MSEWDRIRELTGSDWRQKLQDVKAFSMEPSKKKKLDDPDMVIELEQIGDLQDLSKGWPIQMRDKEVLGALLDDATVKVAVIGQYNRGKTYILNRLAARECRSGALVHTKGLSVSLNQGVAYLDTAGENQPIQMHGPDNTRPRSSQTSAHRDRGRGHTTELEASEDSQKPIPMEVQIKRRLLSSQFLMDLVIEIADVVLVVVNQLTLEDQRYIAKVAEKIDRVQTQDKKAQMIIIHNWKDTLSEKDAEQLIERDIGKAFSASRQMHEERSRGWEKSKSAKTYWKSEQYNSLHLVFTADRGAAAKKWNEQSLQWIHQSLQHRRGSLEFQQMSRSLFKVFTDTCLDWFPIFFKEFSKEELTRSGGSRKKFKFGIWEEETTSKARFVLGPNFDYEFNDVSVSNWEIMYERKGDVYTLNYKIHQGSEETLIHVEIPGVFIDDPNDPDKFDYKEDRNNPFCADFSWKCKDMASDAEILKVTIYLAKNIDLEPSVHIHANRTDDYQVKDLHEMPGEQLLVRARKLSIDHDGMTLTDSRDRSDLIEEIAKKASQFRGPAAKNSGGTTLKVQFKDHFPKGPQQFLDPQVHVQTNGLLKISLAHASRRTN